MAGRPSKYKEDYAEQAEKICTLFGADDKEMAKFFKVAKSTINLWKLEHEQFSDSLKRGKDSYDTKKVELSLLDRALGYEHEEIKFFSHEGEVTDERTVTKHYPPDVTALIFWLKNRNPKRWRDIKAMELTGKDGGPIETKVIVYLPDNERNKC